MILKDTLTGYTRSVDNVPFALAFTASTLSSVGTGITRAIETVFQPAPSYVGGQGFQQHTFDQLAYSQTGFMFAAHVMSQMKGVQLTNDDMMDNMKEFVNQCVVYDALIGTKYTMHDLKRSDDIWGLVSRGASQLRGFAWRDVARDANGEFNGSTGTTIVTCKAGALKLNDMWTSSSTSLVTKFEDRLREQCGLPAAKSAAVLSNAVHMNLPGALNKLVHSAKDASKHLQQQVMISSLLLGNDRKSIELGGSPNFDVRRAYLQQRDTYQTIGQTMAHTLPSLKNVFEALVYALFIFVIMVAMLPNGWKMLMFYTKIMLWLQLWPPLFSILNFIMTESLCSATSTAMGTAQGITIENMVGLSNMANDMSATAGYLSAMIPVLSWALIERGGYAFVSMASGILGVSQSAASSAAIEKTTGNYNFGNVSLEGTQAYNSNMLKQDSSASYTGGHFATNEGMTAKTTTSDGETILHRAESQLPVSVSMQQSREDVLHEAQAKADSLQTSNSEAASNSQRSAMSNYIEFGKQVSSSHASGISYDNQETTNVMNEAANNYEKLKNISDKYGISKDIVNQHATTMSGGVNIPFVVGHLGAEHQNTEMATATAQAATEELNQLVKSDSFRDSMSHMQQASKNKTFNTNDQELNQLVTNVSGSLEKSQQYESQSNKAREVSESIQAERSHNRSQGRRVDANFTQDWVNQEGADKLQHMSTRELQISGNQFADNKMESYRESIFQKFDAAGLRQSMDERYKNQSLDHSAQDVKRSYDSHKYETQNSAKMEGLIKSVDHSAQGETEQMMAVNTSTLKLRGAANKTKVQQGEENFFGQVKKDAKTSFVGSDAKVAINRYRGMSNRNHES